MIQRVERMAGLVARLEPNVIDLGLDGDGLAALAAAAEELEASAEQIGGLLSALAERVSKGDRDMCMDSIFDLRELFEHLGVHCEEVVQVLTEAASRAETAD